MTTKKEIVLMDRFQARDEEGNVHTLIIYQTYITSETESGISRIPAEKRVQTIYGQFVNIIDETTFELVGQGLTLKRI